MTTQAPTPIQFCEKYKPLSHETNEALTSWTKNEKGVSQLAGIEFPSKKTEDWKYVPLNQIFEREYHLSTFTQNPACPIFKEWNGPYTHQIVFNNGVFSKEESNLSRLPKGVEVKFIQDWNHQNTARIENTLKGFTKKPESDAFMSLNRAFLHQGIWLTVPKGVVIEEPIHVAYYFTASDTNFMIHPRNVFQIEDGAKVNIFESYLSFYQSSYFNNNWTSLLLGEGACVEHIRLQNESDKAYHVGTFEIVQEKNSILNSWVLSQGAKLSRQNINCYLRGENSEVSMKGLYLLKDSAFSDIHTNIHHEMPNCKSTQLYKGILFDKGRAVFNGAIHVHKNASGTNSSQLNKNLLLSDSARVDTKPELQIDNDDVQCSHGATIGQLSEEEIFYCQSRGLSRERATSMLLHGFGEDILEGILLKQNKSRLQGSMERFFSSASK